MRWRDARGDAHRAVSRLCGPFPCFPSDYITDPCIN
jgi:hypothetical protein